MYVAKRIASCDAWSDLSLRGLDLDLVEHRHRGALGDQADERVQGARERAGCDLHAGLLLRLSERARIGQVLSSRRDVGRAADCTDPYTARVVAFIQACFYAYYYMAVGYRRAPRIMI